MCLGLQRAQIVAAVSRWSTRSGGAPSITRSAAERGQRGAKLVAAGKAAGAHGGPILAPCCLLSRRIRNGGHHRVVSNVSSYKLLSPYHHVRSGARATKRNRENKDRKERNGRPSESD